MGLADDLRAPPPSQQLRVDVILAELGKADRAALLDALNDPKVPGRQIERACRKNGIGVSDSAITTWRVKNGVK